MRLTLLEVAQRVIRNAKTGAITIDGLYEVALVYYRTGYQIEQYISETSWEARNTLECSLAIKCPSIDVHLTTFKKFQQAFGDEKLLMKVMGDKQQGQAEKIKGLFDGLWTLEYLDTDSKVQEVVKKAILNPHDYVIKPQKEGGGNNFYGEKVRAMLVKAQSDKEALEDIR